VSPVLRYLNEYWYLQQALHLGPEPYDIGFETYKWIKRVKVERLDLHNLAILVMPDILQHMSTLAVAASHRGLIFLQDFEVFGTSPPPDPPVDGLQTKPPY
jgi:hypothetical protein